MPRNVNIKTRFLFYLLGSCLLCSGCVYRIESGDGTISRMTTPELRRYARKVFEYHNQTVSDLMLFTATSETLQVSDRDMLEKAEYKMFDACGAINEVAVQFRDTGGAKLSEKMEVPDSLGKCERATQRVDALLETLKET